MTIPVSFKVSLSDPHSHLLEVEMHVLGLAEDTEVVLRMPVWTPGSYLIREYSRHVQELVARGPDGDQRPVEKVDKASWKVDVSACDSLVVTYKVFAHELSVRTNHVDGSHGFFNCVATCLYPDGQLDQPVELEVVPPAGWSVFCGLPRRTAPDVWRFTAKDFDELFDTPVEMGPHRSVEFEVDGVPHQFVIWGKTDLSLEAIARDLPKVVAQNARLFGEIPYERYVFINHFVEGKYGGLEHRHSSVNLYHARFDSSEQDEDGDFGDRYSDFLRLLSHEHFHAYHVKRLRPEALGPFDYQRENYTRALWAVEGVTSYFDTYQLLQAELISAGRYVELLEKRIGRLLKVPGRFIHSLEESGFDAWIKLYRPDENTKNSSVSYYLKGEIVTWLIDLWIRHHTGGERSMADALRRLWAEYYKAEDVGFPRGAGQAAVTAVAERDADEVFRTLVRGRDEISWEEYLAPVGLKLEFEEVDEDRGWWGIETRRSSGRPKVSFVARHSPAEAAGLYAGDEIVAVDGWEATAKNIDDLVGNVEPGETVDVHVVRRARLERVPVTSGVAPSEKVTLKKRPNASEQATALLSGWLGTTEW